MSGGSACEQCFCLGGTRRCVRPACLPPPPGCKARAASGACCPQRYYCDHSTSTDVATSGNVHGKLLVCVAFIFFSNFDHYISTWFDDDLFIKMIILGLYRSSAGQRLLYLFSIMVLRYCVTVVEMLEIFSHSRRWSAAWLLTSRGSIDSDIRQTWPVQCYHNYLFYITYNLMCSI